MDLDELIGKLQAARSLYGNHRVVIGTSSQVENNRIPDLKRAFQIPIADNSELGDRDGEVDSLFLVTKGA